jgi:hypothetical protein
MFKGAGQNLLVERYRHHDRLIVIAVLVFGHVVTFRNDRKTTTILTFLKVFLQPQRIEISGDDATDRLSRVPSENRLWSFRPP